MAKVARRMAVWALMALFPAVLLSCAELKQSKPLLPMREYEKMIVGRLDADYVGTANCVSKCHAHDKIADDFSHSVHGEQIKPETGLPLVNCESCHGPGSLAIAHLSDDREKNTEEHKKCDTSTFIDLMRLPPPGPIPHLSEMPLRRLDPCPRPMERQRPCRERRQLLRLPQAP